MAIMTKRGNLDNIVTYEHICDTYEDLQNIDPKYATLGSTAIVINQEEGLNAYMATSAGEWVSIAAAGSGGGSEGITPTGTYNITANGTYNVTRYATAKVNVPSSYNPMGTLGVHTNKTVYDVGDYKYVDVQINTPELVVTENGTYTGDINGAGYNPVIVNLSQKNEEIILPSDTMVLNNAKSATNYNSYSQIRIAPKGISNRRPVITPSATTQYIYGRDMLFIPPDTNAVMKASDLFIILPFDSEIPAASYYYLRLGSLRVKKYNSDATTLISDNTYSFTKQYLTPNGIILYSEDLLFQLNTTGIRILKRGSGNNYFTISVVLPILLEKIGKFTVLDSIIINDSSPSLINYQLDTSKVNFTHNYMYAILADTYHAANLTEHKCFFEPFVWDSENGYKKRDVDMTYPNMVKNCVITPDYKLTLNENDVLPTYGTIYICSLTFNEINNYEEYVTVKPAPQPTGVKYIWTENDGATGPWNVSGYEYCLADGTPLLDGHARFWLICNAPSYYVDIQTDLEASETYPIKINWGDGTVLTYTSRKDFQHYYSQAGERYVVDVEISSGSSNYITVSNFSGQKLIYVELSNNGDSHMANSLNTSHYLKKVTIDDSIIYLTGNAIFSDCDALTEVILPSNLKRIPRNCFLNCSSLEELNLPSQLESIDSAFTGCTSLSTITITATTPPTLAANAFPLNNNLKIYVPADSVEAYKTAENWSAYASYITAIQE